MSTFREIGLAFTVIAATATAAAAEIKKIGEAEGWDVAVNSAMGPGCLIMKEFDGIQVQLGIDAAEAEPSGYMAAYARGEFGVTEGDVADIKFNVDGQTFDGVAIGEQSKGFEGVWVPVNNADFVYDLAKAETLTISDSAGDQAVVSLAGTNAAFEAMRACQEEQ